MKFDIEAHKAQYHNYFEVVVSPEGEVEYARPSHQTYLIEKAKKADVATLTKIVDKMTEEVSTSYSNKELLGMAVYLQSYDQPRDKFP